MEDFSIPRKALHPNQLALEVLEEEVEHGDLPGCCSRKQTVHFWGTGTEEQLQFTVEASEVPLKTGLGAVFLCLILKIPSSGKDVYFLACLKASLPRNLSALRRTAVLLSAALPHVPPLTSPSLFEGTEQHFHSN